MTKRKTIYIFTIIVIIALTGYYTKDDMSTIASGVFTSVVASLIFFVFTEVIDDTGDHLDAILNDEKESIKKIDNYINSDPESLKRKFGITKVECRKAYSYGFWIDFLDDAEHQDNRKFIISGRTLNRWLEDPIRDNFLRTLQKLIKNNVPITFVIYKKLTSEQEKKEKQNLKIFLFDKVFPELAKMYTTDTDSINKAVKIYEIGFLPYLYTATDRIVVVSQYFRYINNAENIMFAFEADSDFAKRYNDDFDKMLKAEAKQNTWLSDYLKKHKV